MVAAETTRYAFPHFKSAAYRLRVNLAEIVERLNHPCELQRLNFPPRKSAGRIRPF